MIDSILGTSSYQALQSTSSVQSSSSLTSSQQETISSVLSNFDASSLSSSDAQEIVSAFQDANITPTKELANYMDTLGFDAQEIGQLAGVNNGMPPPPPPPPSGEGSEQDSISSVLDILLNGEEDDETEATTSFDTILDYTSRIISLNDDAKDSVQELLESYSPQNTDLSRSDAKVVVQNALSQILNDTSNYKTTSFYG